MTALSTLINEYLRTNNLSQTDLVKASGLSRARISQLALGQGESVPRASTLEKLAKGLKLPLSVVQEAALMDSGIAFDHKIEPKPLSPSPSGDGHTLSEQLGTSKEVTRYLIDIILAIYSSGERFWSEDGYWVDLEAAFEEYLDLEAGDAIANRGWDARLEKVIRDNLHGGERYAASVYLGMLHNYVRSH